MRQMQDTHPPTHTHTHTDTDTHRHKTHTHTHTQTQTHRHTHTQTHTHTHTHTHTDVCIVYNNMRLRNDPPAVRTHICTASHPHTVQDTVYVVEIRGISVHTVWIQVLSTLSSTIKGKQNEYLLSEVLTISVIFSSICTIDGEG